MSVALLCVSLLLWPALYCLLLGAMHEMQVPRPPRLPFFFIFGTLGGWLLAFALSPSGLAAACVVFLMTASPISLFLSSKRLVSRPERTIFHRVAIWSGYSYLLILGLMIAIGALIR